MKRVSNSFGFCSGLTGGATSARRAMPHVDVMTTKLWSTNSGPRCEQGLMSHHIADCPPKIFACFLDSRFGSLQHELSFQKRSADSFKAFASGLERRMSVVEFPAQLRKRDVHAVRGSGDAVCAEIGKRNQRSKFLVTEPRGPVQLFHDYFETALRNIHNQTCLDGFKCLFDCCSHSGEPEFYPRCDNARESKALASFLPLVRRRNPDRSDGGATSADCCGDVPKVLCRSEVVSNVGPHGSNCNQREPENEPHTGQHSEPPYAFHAFPVVDFSRIVARCWVLLHRRFPHAGMGLFLHREDFLHPARINATSRFV